MVPELNWVERSLLLGLRWAASETAKPLGCSCSGSKERRPSSCTMSLRRYVESKERRMRRVFGAIDHDGDGQLGVEEVHQAARGVFLLFVWV